MLWMLKSVSAQGDESSIGSTVQRAPEDPKIEEVEETPEDCFTESKCTNRNTPNTVDHDHVI